ncbi:MAG: hypothetical protein ACHQJ5_00035 [Vicinamibacteria bacterium]|jgi:hypothetical protein
MTSWRWRGLQGKHRHGFDYGFDPKMGEAIGAATERAEGILLGRTTYEMFEPALDHRVL